MQLLVLALWALVLMVVAVFIGMAVGVSGKPGEATADFLLYNALVQLMTFALPVLLVTWMYHCDSQRAFYKLDFGRRSWRLALAGIVVLVLFVPLTDWLAVWNDGWHFSGVWEPFERRLREAGEQSQGMVESLMKECHPLLNLLGLALVPALCEELFFRAGIQNLLQKWFKSPHAAIWVTAAVFSLAHGEVFAFLPRFLLGALLGYLYVYGRSLLVNVVAHFVNNAIVVVAYALVSGPFDPSAPLAVAPLLTVLCTLAAGALLYVVFLRPQLSDGKDNAGN